MTFIPLIIYSLNIKFRFPSLISDVPLLNTNTISYLSPVVNANTNLDRSSSPVSRHDVIHGPCSEFNMDLCLGNWSDRRTEGIARLDHESLDDPMKQVAVEVAIATVHTEILDRLRTSETRTKSKRTTRTHVTTLAHDIW